MSSSAVEERRARAATAAGAYAADPGVVAVLLGGSAGTGHADRWSDVELGVFWDAAPSEASRLAAVDRARGELLRLFPEEDGVQFDEWTLDGVLLEVVNMSVAGVEAALVAVLERHDPDVGLQSLLAALVDGRQLSGSAALTAWRERALAYPDRLARAVVARYAQIDHFWRFPMFRERENTLLAAKAVTDVQERVLHALLAVNRQYYGGFKSLDAVAARLSLTPPSLLPRLRTANAGLPADAEELLRQLVEETYDLVERHVPGADVDRLRAVFRYRRQPLG